MHQPHDGYTVMKNRPHFFRVGCMRWCTPGMGVNLWGESPLYENQGCPLIYGMLPEVRAEGKGVSVRMGPKEAGWHHPHTGTRRTDEQKSHDKAQSPGELARHNEALEVQGDRVNAAVVHGRFTFLSGEICLPCVRGWCERDHGHP